LDLTKGKEAIQTIQHIVRRGNSEGASRMKNLLSLKIWKGKKLSLY
jgi:hypothetical protein